MNIEYSFQANKLSCFRQQKTLFTDLSFELRAGNVLLIEGPNGSGKSSLLRLLAGLSTPASGEIFWRGTSIHTLQAAYWQDLHYIGHTNGIKLGLTVAENLQLARVLSAAEFAAPFDTVLTKLNLSSASSTQARYLSVGQRRRLALARLFLFNKPLWILDEPFTALDATMQTFFLAQLETHVSCGGLAIVSSHHTLAFQHANVQQLRLNPC